MLLAEGEGLSGEQAAEAGPKSIRCRICRDLGIELGGGRRGDGGAADELGGAGFGAGAVLDEVAEGIELFDDAEFGGVIEVEFWFLARTLVVDGILQRVGEVQSGERGEFR